MSITLSAKEILDLARFTGLMIDETELDDDWYETEYTIAKCHPDGVIAEELPDQPRQHFRFVAWLDEYPEEGVNPLGWPIHARGFQMKPLRPTQRHQGLPANPGKAK